MQSKQEMRAPYGLQIIDSCPACPFPKDGRFCDLSQSLLATLDHISSAATYPRDVILFAEGQKPRGVFVICSGRVKLSTNSANGKSIVVRVAEAGAIIGLPGTISGKPYELTAEALEPLQANFIPRDAFLQFLRQNREVALGVAEMLNQIYYATLAEVRCLGLSVNMAARLARFLLDMPTSPSQNRVRTTLTLTHDEIAETIGSSRETVTRLFTNFKREGYIEVHGSTVMFMNRPGLEALLDSETQRPVTKSSLSIPATCSPTAELTDCTGAAASPATVSW